jgi:hypothetical protein
MPVVLARKKRYMGEREFQVLDASNDGDALQWATLWGAWPAREVFAHPAYVSLYASGHSRPLCATWGSENVGVLYAFLLRDLTVEPFWPAGIPPAWDIVTPYGYGGAFTWGERKGTGVEAEFWRHFDAWANGQNVVSEFVRFSLFPKTLLPYPGDLTERSQNIVRDLELDADALWMDFEHKVRKNVNRARREGVVVKVDATGEALEDFLAIYRSTMDRRNAEKLYYFPEVYFRQIALGLPGQFAYFHACHGARIVSSELVLVSADTVYSFLGGTIEDTYELRPNDLLKYEIMLWARQLGKRRFVLGGGYSPDDGIYRYKRTFAPRGSVPFFTGARILNQGLYEALVQSSQSVAGQRGTALPRQGYFPAYRA